MMPRIRRTAESVAAFLLGCGTAAPECRKGDAHDTH